MGAGLSLRRICLTLLDDYTITDPDTHRRGHCNHRTLFPLTMAYPVLHARPKFSLAAALLDHSYFSLA
jgi:hypothetical protein